MNCKKIKIQVLDYLDGNLKEKELFEKHLESCRECDKMVREMQNTVKLLNTAGQIDLPPLFHDRLKKSLTDYSSDKTKANVIRHTGREKEPKLVLKRVFQTATVFAACVLIVIGVITGGQHFLRLDSPKEENDSNMFAMDMRSSEIGLAGEAPRETESETRAMTTAFSMFAEGEQQDESNKEAQEKMFIADNRQESYVQDCYKINLITDQKEKTVARIKALFDTYKSRYDRDHYKTVEEGTLILTISLPQGYYNSFADDILALKKEGLISGFIENKVSVIDYGYEAQQIQASIEDYNNQISTIKEKQPENTGLIAEKEKELDKLNTRLVELIDEVQYVNITIEVNGQ